MGFPLLSNSATRFPSTSLVLTCSIEITSLLLPCGIPFFFAYALSKVSASTLLLAELRAVDSSTFVEYKVLDRSLAEDGCTVT